MSKPNFTLNQAFRVLRERGITEMKVGLPETEITVDAADKWAVYSYKKDFYFCVDSDGNVVGGRAGFEKMLSLLAPKKPKTR
jgi:hypothetical protein